MLRTLQVRSPRKASGVVFLTEHANSVISRHTGRLENKDRSKDGQSDDLCYSRIVAVQLKIELHGGDRNSMREMKVISVGGADTL